jgi:membrane protein implicated in regulation of membrane protease activity
MESPTGRQLFGLRMMGLIAPPSSAGIAPRVRGILLGIVLVVGVLAIAFGLVYGIAQIFGGLSVDVAIFYAIVLLLIVLGVLAFYGRRRQKRMQAERAEQLAARPG